MRLRRQNSRENRTWDASPSSDSWDSTFPSLLLSSLCFCDRTGKGYSLRRCWGLSGLCHRCLPFNCSTCTSTGGDSTRWVDCFVECLSTSTSDGQSFGESFRSSVLMNLE